MLHLVATVPTWIRSLADLLEVDTAKLTGSLVAVLLIWLLCYLGMRVVSLVARRIEAAVDDGDDATLNEREQRRHTISELLRSVGRVVFFLMGLLLTLNSFIDIRPLLAGAGILGLAVSFGAQSLVKDVLAGFFFVVEGQFAVGDVIEASGHSGVVERMTLRMVVLRDLHGAVHMIPNGQIAVISNLTRTWSRAVMDVAVAYGTDLDRALAVLVDEAGQLAADPTWASRLDGPPEAVGVQSLADGGATLRVLLRTQPGQHWAVEREFRRRIKNRLDLEGIESPFTHRTLHLRMEEPPGPLVGGDRGAAGLPGPRVTSGRDAILPPEPPA